MTEPQTSIIGRFKQVALILVAVVSVATLATLGVLTSVRQKVLIDQVEQSLLQDINEQVDKVLLGEIIPEQRTGILQYLESVKSIEQLKNIEKLESLGKTKFKNCYQKKKYTICNNKSQQILSVLAPIEEGGKKYGFLLKSKYIDQGFVNPIVAHSIWIITLMVSVSLAIVLVIVYFVLRRDISDSLTKLLTGVESTLAGNYDDKGIGSKYVEFIKLEASIVALVKQYEKTKKEMAFAEMARRVAHDIRSPLTALQVAVQDLEVEPQRKSLIQKATTRIREIAEDLLAKYKKGIEPQGKQKIVNTWIYLACESLVQEKIVEFKHRGGFSLQLQSSASAAKAFAKVDLHLFRRVLSNLINNAIESIENSGFVSVNLELSDQKLHIQIQDNGCGIPKELISRVGSKNFSYNKDGSGLGVFTAKEALMNWGGTFKVDSQEGKGTAVRATLPLQPTEPWAAIDLDFLHKSQIFVVDDDVSIHEIWKQKLANKISITSYYSFEEFKKQVIDPNALYLVDYETSEETTGIEAILFHQIQSQSILVTGNFDQQDVINKCIDHEIQLLPKPIIQFL